MRSSSNNESFRESENEREKTKENINDNIENIQSSLISTLSKSNDSFNKLISRSLKLDELQEKSDTLVNDTKRFQNRAEWENLTLFWKLIHYINIFRLCKPGSL